MMRTILMVSAAALAAGAWIEAPALRRSHIVAAPRVAAAVAPTMIIDQVAAAGDKLKGAAVEAVVKQKVEEKLAKAQEKYEIPDQYVKVMSGFFSCYMTEVYNAGHDIDHYEEVLTSVFKQVVEKAASPHEFEPYHKAMREPFDYYALGNEFAKPLINADASEIVGRDMIDQIQQQVAAGDNVVLLANHQSEADPQIFSVLLDPIVPGFAESTIFVAGDRVTTDLLAQPFSMGRNLLCIYSKKHIENPPELKSKKSRHNRNVMKEMQNLFKEGGKIVWVAPSGGRDRRGSDGEYEVAPFDAKSVEMFRLMADKAGRPTHFYPLSMLTYAVCPPPEAVGGDVGERRTVKYSPAALHFAPAVDLKEFAAGCVVENFPADCNPNEERDALREALAQHIHGIVQSNYGQLTQKLGDSL
jgi:glycerol-3-phosphate O-acyltransferase